MDRRGRSKWGGAIGLTDGLGRKDIGNARYNVACGTVRSPHWRAVCTWASVAMTLDGIKSELHFAEQRKGALKASSSREWASLAQKVGANEDYALR